MAEHSDAQPLKTLVAALDRAALGEHGMTFFNGRGEVEANVSYGRLREDARAAAMRLLGIGLQQGDRVALVAETRVEFAILFFACQYAGLVPVPLPAVVNLGGRDHYQHQLAFLIENSGATAAFASAEFLPFLMQLPDLHRLRFAGSLEDLPAVDSEPTQSLPEISTSDVAYVQYTSGSTRVARGAVITQRAVMVNLEAIVHEGLRLTEDDRFFSWLPFYHDMGLVGKLLVPVAGGTPAGYIGTREFALRPRLWLSLMDKTQATISFSPPFGYELCARRLRDGDGARYRLGKWRIAGVGAEMIRPQSLEAFALATVGSGFDSRAFQPCYGMAEVGLAISFCPLGSGYAVDEIDRTAYMDGGHARPVGVADDPARASRKFVDCGLPLPGTRVEVRSEAGSVLPDREIGVLWVATDSAMTGYLNEPEATREVLEDGWVNTGDMGYSVDGHLYITGRQKDVIIVNGRNVFPQDLEAVAEAQPGIRSGDAMVFSVPDDDSRERVVMLVQCRTRDPETRAFIKDSIEARTRSDFGLACHVELVEAHSLPRTSSGKPSRAQARSTYLSQRNTDPADCVPG